MVSKAQKEEFEDKTLDENDFDSDYELSTLNHVSQSTNISLPEIPIADLSDSKKPPINLRIHNTKKSLEIVKIQDIVGIAFENAILDSEFKPKHKFRNKAYRKVWKWVHQNPTDKTTFDSQTITLAKVKENNYYVMEGIRRVSALKFSRFESVKAEVIDYTGIYNKILERKEKVKKLRSQSTKQIIKKNTGFKPVKPSFKPTPIKKA